MDHEINEPATGKEMDTLRSGSGAEIALDDLSEVAGGKASMRGIETTDFTCPYCGQVLRIRDTRDASRHVSQECPQNPYK